MNWTDLSERVLFGLDPQKRSLYRKASTTYLFDAQEDFVIHTKCLEFNFQSTLTKGQYSIALPDQFLQVQRISWEGEPLVSMPVWADVPLKDDEMVWHSGVPDQYFIQANVVYIYPAPDQAGQLTIWCTGVFGSGTDNQWELQTTETWGEWITTYASSTHEPYIPFEYQKYLVDYARAMILMDEGDLPSSNHYMGRYDTNKEMVRKIYLRRKTEQKTRVYDATTSATRYRTVIFTPPE